MIISVDKEKSFNTIQHPFMIKVLKTKTRRQLPHCVKRHVWNLIANIPNGESLQALPIWSEARQ